MLFQLCTTPLQFYKIPLQLRLRSTPILSFFENPATTVTIKAELYLIVSQKMNPFPSASVIRVSLSIFFVFSCQITKSPGVESELLKCVNSNFTSIPSSIQKRQLQLPLKKVPSLELELPISDEYKISICSFLNENRKLRRKSYVALVVVLLRCFVVG
jgi:hypothetical protein